MTSKNSFFKLMKEDLRQQLWCIVLSCIVFLLPLPIYVGMMLSNDHGLYDITLDLAGAMSKENFWLIMVTVFGALVCAVSGFGYLFSKKKVDFFHSLPVKRERLFAVRYLNGVLIYLVPYLAMLLINVVIIAVNGKMKTAIWSVLLEGLVVHLLGFLVLYTVFILCVTMVGNIVVFFAVSGWMLSITLVALLLYTWFEEQFFDTYSFMGDAFAERIYSLRFLCPGYFYFVEVFEARGDTLLWQQLLYVIVLIVIALVVYRIRSSEGAGKAIAFPVLKPVIRVSIEVLAGGCLGMMFYNAADSNQAFPGWMIFGVVLGVVLSHILVQSVFYYDVRKCLKGKLSMLACVAVTAGFVLIMRYDVFGYDTYLPKEKKIESVGIEVNDLDGYRGAYIYTLEGGKHVSEVEDMKLTDISAIYPYLEALVADSEAYYDYDSELNKWNSATKEQGVAYISVRVVYRLKNGKEVYRDYMAKGLREDLFRSVFESEEFKETHYADVYTVQPEQLQFVTVRHAMSEVSMNLSLAEKEQLLQLLRSDITAQTLSEKLHTLPVAILELYAEVPDSMERGLTYNNSHTVPLYASCAGTLNFLAERGFTATKEYQWTGGERMRVRLPEEIYKGLYDDNATYYDMNWEKYSYAWEQKVAVVEDWSYGNRYIPVEPEDFARLYALCSWESLYDYGEPRETHWNDYRVEVDIPIDGYNNYNTYVFVVDRSEDLSFLYD